MPYLGPKPVNVRSASSLIVDGNLTAGQVNSDGAVIATGAGTFGDDVNITGDVDVTGAISGSLTTASLPAGSVLQVVGNSFSVNQETTSTSLVSTAVTLSITPSSASSRIYFAFTFNHQSSGGADTGALTAILRNDTTNLTINGSTNALIYSANSSNVHHEVTLQGIDSPASTNEVTYTLYHASFSGAASNSSAIRQWGKAFVTLMEIAG
jgi:hypothetical protein